MSMFKSKILRQAVAGAATFLIGCTGAIAQGDYPSHSIRLIVPFAPGGSTDLVGRLIAEYVGRDLGKPMVVENKAGAGGALGAEQVARAKPDGYTLLMATVSTHGSNPAIYPELKYDARKDFAPISNVMGVPSIFAVHPNVPAKTMPEFIELAKADPEKYTFASPGVASLPRRGPRPERCAGRSGRCDHRQPVVHAAAPAGRSPAPTGGSGRRALRSPARRPHLYRAGLS
jgi:tripartite-type tricarboxylate transporter receptor subunit TctC